jgi:hypothetical protein
MSDLPDDQLPKPQDPATVPVMGRRKYHPDYVWIVRALEAVDETQAALAKHLGWDEPTMSRQLKGKRELKAKELTLIHSFFSARGLIVRTGEDNHNPQLTILRDRTPPGDGARVEAEGKRMLTETIKDVARLEDRLKAVENRLLALEQQSGGAKKDRPQ